MSAPSGVITVNRTLPSVQASTKGKPAVSVKPFCLRSAADAPVRTTLPSAIETTNQSKASSGGAFGSTRPRARSRDPSADQCGSVPSKFGPTVVAGPPAAGMIDSLGENPSCTANASGDPSGENFAPTPSGASFVGSPPTAGTV